VAQGASQQTLLPPAKAGGAYVVAPSNTPPATQAELKALRAKRVELSTQIQSVANRRSELADQLQSLPAGAQKGILERIAVIDARILGLERELDLTGQALANAPSALLATESVTPPVPFQFTRAVTQDLVPIVAILSVFVLGPLSVALSRSIWKRTAAPSDKQILTEQAAQQRLDQLQQAVDTIAIEVERISEGQRFISKALSERALPAGADRE
jgi:cell division protein FtsB